MLDSIFNPDCHHPASYVRDKALSEVTAKAHTLTASCLSRDPQTGGPKCERRNAASKSGSPHTASSCSAAPNSCTRPSHEPYLTLAAPHADQAATLGLVALAPVVLQVGFYLRDVGDAVGTQH